MHMMDAFFSCGGGVAGAGCCLAPVGTAIFLSSTDDLSTALGSSRV